MSEENDKEPDIADNCRNLAEELLREMPDMKVEIEQELIEALSRSSDDRMLKDSVEETEIQEDIVKDKNTNNKKIHNKPASVLQESEGLPSLEAGNVKDKKEKKEEKAVTENEPTVVQQESENHSSSLEENIRKQNEEPKGVEQDSNEPKQDSNFEVAKAKPQNDDAEVEKMMDIQENTYIQTNEKETEEEKADTEESFEADMISLTKEKVDHDNGVEKIERNELKIQNESMTSTDCVKNNEEVETVIDANNLSKNESEARKREKEEESMTNTSIIGTDNGSPAAKQPKLELSNERKSIIEIHIANKVADNDDEALAELERIRKLKEQNIIELNKLKCQEDKLLRLENISKQLQKNIEQNRNNLQDNIAEENIVKNNVDAEVGESLSQTHTNEEVEENIEQTTTERKLVVPRSTEPLLTEIENDKVVQTAVPSSCVRTGVTEISEVKMSPSTKTKTDNNLGIETRKSFETTFALNDISKSTESKYLNIVVQNKTTFPSTATTEPPAGLVPTPIKPVVTQQLDENSNQSTNAEPEHHLPPEELTPEEEERDRELRASRATFLQHLPCFKLQRNTINTNINLNSTSSDSNDNSTSNTRNIPRCRECRRRNAHGGSDVYCRFYEFRRLQYNEAGDLIVAGFPNPYRDPTHEDLRIWQPDAESVPTAGWMDIQVARYILLHAGDQFCYLWQQEAEALRLHENPNSVIAWKKIVQGLREICDVCDTTLFNFHWTCEKCGFGVCLDCFKDRKEQRSCYKRHSGDKTQRGHDDFHWMLCTATAPTHQKHEPRELMLTQTIAGDALNVLGRLLHDIRALWQVPQMCGCLLSKQKLPPDTELGILIQDMIKESQLKQQTSASSLATEETLRKQARMEELHAKKLEFARARGIDYVPGRVWTKQTLGKDPITTAFDNFKHINFLRKGLAGLRRFLPPRAMTLTYSTMLAPGVPHEWLCDGKFLRLTNSMHPDNRILFQEVWKCGQPVMISEVAKSLNLDLWRPEAFCRDFGDKPNDLINCLNGNLVPNQPMRYFWEGFQCIKKRLLDAHGKPMLLKLKDWPPGDDFAEILPTRFADLMTGLPMPEYTLRTGNLNIASCLPKMFVPPDLGPKMYNAYGSALHPDKGTTNLHLDISDAVNIMVYVGVPQDADSKPQLVATQRAIALGGCDYLTRARCQSPGVLPGALWHIFPARDADKIRDLLNRVTIEKGFRLQPDHDPIHDQNWYLDDKLRARLFKEYGVEGYPIVQCLGDAVFIPAGAPHQVQNLHNCIKVAEDFVSPENITHCYHLTHEFRHLSHSHTNHEDKLQIKNIIYHSIKDCCHILVRALDQRLDEELAKVTEQNNKA